jgi:uncharacterized circularly permuted ATP-grasp superfamily protein/uncharacterized alpha-E superfamily protein
LSGQGAILPERAAPDALAAYRPLTGVPDEMMDAGGQVRATWRRFISRFSTFSDQEIAARFSRGDQYLRDAGVYYRQYGEEGSREREWPLSHIPVLIDEAEWRWVEEGLVQRAELLERVARDLYGANQLVRDGHLPASLIGQSPLWLRPLVGLEPRSGNYLKFIAVEIGRGPDGQWWVLGDRTEAPSGAGFALENRVATSRIFPDLFGEANVHRLAGFFQTFKDRLRSLRAEPGSAIAILTPGQLNDTYFEHAYIARYLGFLLLEGEDLTVENGRLMVRTVAGLAPISVLWRRLDSAYADPLELNEGSRLGVPGLVQAIRERHVSLVNALGVGVLEMRALLAFLPRISEVLMGEPLKMPNIATWWCGHERERALVRENAGRMIVGSAFSTRLAFDRDESLDLARPDAFDAFLEAQGRGLVGQEMVSLSTTPSFVDGRLQPRPMTLRVFLARDTHGWRVMPGGYARIGSRPDAAAIAMQKGGSAADVWIVSDRPVPAYSLLPGADEPYRRAEAGVLASRTADNLYWLGRYVERAEGAIRHLRAFHRRLAESGREDNPPLRRLGAHLTEWGVDLEEAAPTYLLQTLAHARASASRARDRFSVDGWMALTDLERSARRIAERAEVGDDAAGAMGVLLRKITGFAGLVHENMHHSDGWLFLSIGRSLERAITMCQTLAVFADPDAPEGCLDIAVEAGDSAMIHRRRYAVATNRAAVIDLLALDALNPRAIIYHLTRIRELIEELPGGEKAGQMSGIGRAVLHAQAGLLLHTPETLDTQTLFDLSSEIAAVSDVLSTTYFR